MQRLGFILRELGYLFRQSPLTMPLKLVYWTAKGTLRQKLHYHRARRIILASGLFDPDYYVRTYPTVAIDPLHHYLITGAAEARNPCQLFDAGFYASQQPDGFLLVWNPLLHYLQIGASEGLDPHLLFDSSFYLERHPDVAQAGINPLQHYLTLGAKEGRDPHPLFDSAFYLEMNPAVANERETPVEHYLDRGFRQGCIPHWMFDPAFYLSRNPDVAAAGVNPLLHFVQYGAREMRDPHPLFDCSFYLSTQPDVRIAGVNPLEHFVRYGAREGRSPHFLFDFKAYLSLHPALGDYQDAAKQIGKAVMLQFRSPQQQPTTPMSEFIQNHVVEVYDGPRRRLSVVIPTHNRVDVLERTLQRSLQVSRHLPVEFMVVSDGSTDNTLNCLDWYRRNHENVYFAAVEKAGPGAARNLGVARTRGDLIMFMGDDIRPVDAEFFAAHLRAHEKFSEPETVVEGHVQWPRQSGFQITAVMRLIQGRGAQQFSYHYMQPHEFFDWRHFWSANISIKRHLVENWTKDGFNPIFDRAAYEDIEFAYRISKGRQNFRIYYAAESVGEHFHQYGLAGFIKRQINAGEMARKLIELHPELARLIHVEELDHALRSTPDPKDAYLLPEFEGVVRGFKAWGAVMEAHEDLGTQEWHDAYLNALLQLCHGEGYLSTFCGKGGNIAEGYRVLLRLFQQQMATSRSAVPILHAIALS